MKRQHTTKEGVTMLIAEMTEHHLKCTINLFCNRIKSNLASIDNLENLKPSAKFLLFGRSNKNEENIDVDKILQHTERDISNLTTYVLEAALRGYNISSELSQAFGRSTALISPNNQLEAPEEATVLKEEEFHINAEQNA